MSYSSHFLTHPKYRADIDGLRAVAVLSVVVFHAFPQWIRGGFIGVDIFFVISGFLISTIIFSNLESATFSLLEFYIRRIKRIFPALLVVLVFSYIVGWFVLLPSEYSELGKHITSGVFFVSNLTLWSESGYFDTTAEVKPLLHLWSLGIEEQFYLLWPVILIFAWKKKYNLMTLILAFGTISYFLNVKGIKEDATATFYSPQTRFWELLCGALLAWTSINASKNLHWLKLKLDLGFCRVFYRTERPNDGQSLANFCAATGLFLLIIGFYRINPNIGFPGKWALIPTLGAMLIITAGPGAWINRVILSNRLAVGIGLISFPLYLWHWPLLSFAHIMEGGTPRADIRLGAVVLAIALAWATYHFIERPLRFGKQNYTKIAALCFLMILLGALGWYTKINNGLPFRMESNINLKSLEQTAEPKNILFSDGSCEKFLNFSTGGVCLTNSSAPDLLFVGDSHVMALAGSAVVGKVSLNYMLRGTHGCPPMLGYSIMDQKNNKGCHTLAIETLAILAKYPSIKTVVLSSRGPFYFSGEGYGIEGPNSYSIFALDGSMKSQAEMFEDGYSKFITNLISLHKKVVFVIDPPELGEDPKGCLVKRPVSILEKTVSTCAQDRAKVDKRQAVYRKIINNIQLKNPTLLIYDPIDLFCDKVYCHGIRERKLLYRDDDHISFWGSEIILNNMLSNNVLP